MANLCRNLWKPLDETDGYWVFEDWQFRIDNENRLWTLGKSDNQPASCDPSTWPNFLPNFYKKNLLLDENLVGATRFEEKNSNWHS